ncbi:MAG: hypothetical protein M1838_000009 [Thelocarpon superellum]|nr:MAG: hypothetical protein M1838_000009 [Thelocarpon superellum]
MPVRWDDHAHVRLLINILKVHEVKLDYNALAAAMGEGCTAKAISHRIFKLRKEAESADGSVPRTPQKEPKSAAKVMKRHVDEISTEDDKNDEGYDNDDVDEEKMVLAKKRKRSAAKTTKTLMATPDPSSE